MAAANAEAARTAAEEARAAAAAAQATAAAAQATAEAARDAANMAADAAAEAQGMAEGDRDAANMAAAAAADAQTKAEGERDTANAAATAAADAQTKAEGERDTANAAATAAADAQTKAEGERDTANAAATAAAEAQTKAEGERDTANAAATAAAEAQTTAEGERDAAIKRAEMAEAAKMKADDDLAAAIERAETAETALAEITKETAEAMAEVARQETIAREAAVRTAFGSNRVGTAAKALPDASSDVTAVAATRDAADMVMIDVNGETDDVYSGGNVDAGSAAWTSAMLTKMDVVTEATDTVVIYTDIEAPADELLTSVYNQDALDDALDTERVAKAMSSGFPSDPDTDWEYTGADGGRALTVTGTFDGVSGQFTCTTAPCTVTTNAESELEASDNWRFTPTSPLTDMVKVPDDAYAYFGWWLNKPKANDGVHDVEVFAGGTTGHEASTVHDDIVGSASYTGPAAGKYVTKTFKAGVQTEAGVGHFTATANLVAKFGAADDAGMLGGTVTSFMLDDTTSAPWRVTLEDADLSNGQAIFNGNTNVNFGGGFVDADAANTVGTWQGSFYGGGATDADAPSTVAGTFDAVTDNAAVIGGFGATKQ